MIDELKKLITQAIRKGCLVKDLLNEDEYKEIRPYLFHENRYLMYLKQEEEEEKEECKLANNCNMSNNWNISNIGSYQRSYNWQVANVKAEQKD